MGRRRGLVSRPTTPNPPPTNPRTRGAVLVPVSDEQRGDKGGSDRPPDPARGAVEGCAGGGGGKHCADCGFGVRGLEGRSRKRLPGPTTKVRDRQSEIRNANLIAIIVGGRVKYAARPGATNPRNLPRRSVRPAKETEKQRERLAFDPRFLQAETGSCTIGSWSVNSDPLLLAGEGGKSDVSRTLGTAGAARPLPEGISVRPLLPAA